MKFHPALDTPKFRELTYRLMDLAEQLPEAFEASVEKSRKAAKEAAAKRQKPR